MLTNAGLIIAMVTADVLKPSVVTGILFAISSRKERPLLFPHQQSLGLACVDLTSSASIFLTKPDYRGALTIKSQLHPLKSGRGRMKRGIPDFVTSQIAGWRGSFTSVTANHVYNDGKQRRFAT